MPSYISKNYLFHHLQVPLSQASSPPQIPLSQSQAASSVLSPLQAVPQCATSSATPISISISVGQNSITSAHGPSASANVTYNMDSSGSQVTSHSYEEGIPFIDLTSSEIQPQSSLSAWEYEQVN